MSSAAELLRDARLRARLSQAALARKAGIPRSVLNAYERGNRQPGADAWIAILLAAGFAVDLRPIVDVERNAQILEQVIDLAEALPYAPAKRLGFPPFRKRVA